MTDNSNPDTQIQWEHVSTSRIRNTCELIEQNQQTDNVPAEKAAIKLMAKNLALMMNGMNGDDLFNILLDLDINKIAELGIKITETILDTEQNGLHFQPQSFILNIPKKVLQQVKTGRKDGPFKKHSFTGIRNAISDLLIIGSLKENERFSNHTLRELLSGIGVNFYEGDGRVVRHNRSSKTEP